MVQFVSVTLHWLILSAYTESTRSELMNVLSQQEVKRLNKTKTKITPTYIESSWEFLAFFSMK
jgi:hypothetical protein